MVNISRLLADNIYSFLTETISQICSSLKEKTYEGRELYDYFLKQCEYVFNP